MLNTYIGIGSNLGDRKAYLQEAIARIEFVARERARVAPVMESEPWGYESQNRFLNTVIAIPWHGTPQELLHALQEIERELAPCSPHRNVDGSYRDRAIDLDIIDIPGVVIDTPTLTIPHPRKDARPFVAGPLKALL
ncbi:MAG: 2-amino-4-hydroxy-6-hydroxymethyldihydropteridine diphosphokinase [Bacteroidales bacterium]|nr:2-amino-4-hydroxy-6-hydroxymethyldihydropteridine diphosphokinase [Bacteroidales bacterium]